MLKLSSMKQPTVKLVEAGGGNVYMCTALKALAGAKKFSFVSKFSPKFGKTLML